MFKRYENKWQRLMNLLLWYLLYFHDNFHISMRLSTFFLFRSLVSLPLTLPVLQFTHRYLALIFSTLEVFSLMPNNPLSRTFVKREETKLTWQRWCDFRKHESVYVLVAHFVSPPGTGTSTILWILGFGCVHRQRRNESSAASFSWPNSNL